MASDDECYGYDSDYDYYDEDDVAMEADEDALVEEDTPAPDRPVDCWVRE
jgi:hypothetical protein